VVVVRAQDDVLVGLAGQIGEHVADHGMFLLDSGIKSDVKSLRKSEGRWIARVVNLMLQVEEVFSLGAEPGSRGIIFDLDNGGCRRLPVRRRRRNAAADLPLL
jgi:hypothetical protein